MIDEYSKYPEVEIVQSTSAKETLLYMDKKIIADKGTPMNAKSDNGSPFQSADFNAYCKEKGIKHHKITPIWPEANGQAENFMRNLNKVARAAYLSGKDWRKEIYVYLGNYRSTPHTSTGHSPRELMKDSSYRDKLPQLPQPPPASRDVVEKKHLYHLQLHLRQQGVPDMGASTDRQYGRRIMHAKLCSVFEDM